MPNFTKLNFTNQNKLKTKISKRGFLFAKKRRQNQIPYCAFFTESWANKCGENVTKEKSIGEMVLE